METRFDVGGRHIIRQITEGAQTLRSSCRLNSIWVVDRDTEHMSFKSKISDFVVM